MDERFLRTEMLLGPQAMERLAAAHVAVFGLGGVGSWCAEALARSGVGALTLVDHDTVGLTNLNRQVEATRSTLGQPKAQAMADRIRDINPDCRLTIRAEKYEAGRREYMQDGRLVVPDCVTVPFIEGDGVGVSNTATVSPAAGCVNCSSADSTAGRSIFLG